MQVGSQVSGKTQTYKISKKLSEKDRMSVLWLVNRESDGAEFALKEITY